MKTEPQLARIIALALLAMIVLLACTRAFAQPQPSTVFRPALLDSAAASFCYSPPADLRHDGTTVGAVAVYQAELSFSGRHAFTPGLLLAYGLAYDANGLDPSGATPLPDQLAALSLNLGLLHPRGPRWVSAIFIRPGFYSDFENLGSRSCNVPVLVSVSYTPRRELAWTFALNYTAFARYPVLPVLGLRWQFAPAWDLQLGFPRTSVTWQASRTLSLHAGAEFLGGSYRITQDPPSVAGAGLGDTLLDYRELRAGAGLEYKLGETLSLSVDAGVVTARKFDYHERNYRLEGRPAGYLKLACNRRF